MRESSVTARKRLTGKKKTARRMNPTRGNCRLDRSADWLRLKSVQEINRLAGVRRSVRLRDRHHATPRLRELSRA